MCAFLFRPYGNKGEAILLAGKKKRKRNKTNAVKLAEGLPAFYYYFVVIRVAKGSRWELYTEPMTDGKHPARVDVLFTFVRMAKCTSNSHLIAFFSPWSLTIYLQLHQNSTSWPSNWTHTHRPIVPFIRIRLFRSRAFAWPAEDQLIKMQ